MANRRRRRRGNRRKKKAGILTNVILIAAICVFCFSAFQLFHIWKGYSDGKSEYKEIREVAITELQDAEEVKVLINFEELLKINPDTVGWIRFDPEPAQINYPLVQGEDNNVYLHKTFSANENTVGAIFVNVENSPDFSDENTIIYGHRMNDNSMFHDLAKYEDKAFWEANPYFYIYTPDGKERKYHIYSAGVVKDVSDTYLTTFATVEEYEKFLQHTKEAGAYDTGIEVTTDNRIVTLSTCTKASNDDRFVVRGVLESEK